MSWLCRWSLLGAALKRSGRRALTKACIPTRDVDVRSQGDYHFNGLVEAPRRSALQVQTKLTNDSCSFLACSDAKQRARRRNDAVLPNSSQSPISALRAASRSCACDLDCSELLILNIPLRFHNDRLVLTLFLRTTPLLLT